MTEERTAGKMRRAILAVSILAIGILGIGTAAWLGGSGASTWGGLYAWYNPPVGFQSAALPVGFEDLVDRIKPTVVGVRARVEQADEEERPSSRGGPSNRSDVPMDGPGTLQPQITTTQGSGFFLSSDGTVGPGDIDLGSVPATMGNYNVPIPPGVDIDGVNFALVHCVPANFLFASAPLS